MLHLQEERERLGLRGLLPAGVVPLSVQLDNLMEQLRGKSSDIERYNYLATIQVRPTRHHFVHVRVLLPLCQAVFACVCVWMGGLVGRSVGRCGCG